MTVKRWEPENPQQTRMWQFMNFVSQHQGETFHNYQDLYSWSIKQPKIFWKCISTFFEISFSSPYYQVLNEYEQMIDAHWFIGARFNFAQKLLSRRDDHTALICINENGIQQKLSYEQLHLEVAQCIAGLKLVGIEPGDRIAGLMPNTAQTIIAMLASSALGAIWSSCSPDYGAQAALDRLTQIAPKVLFCCDGHQYQGKKYSAWDRIKQLHYAMPTLEQVVICPNINEPLDISSLTKTLYWNDFIQSATECTFLQLPFDHPLYIVFSSGTTGKPKCIMHGAGGTLLQHVKELGLHSNLTAQDNLCFYTTCGWMMWNWMVSALALGTTLTLYEGSPVYPNIGSLLEYVANEKITVFGTSAKFLSTIEKSGLQPKVQWDFSHLKCILSTGSPLLPNSYDFVYQHIKKDLQLSSISGGTDILSCFALGNPILPVYKGELQCLGLGMAVAIFDEQGRPLLGKRGELVCTKPFPSMPVGFWNDPDKALYKKAYFERFPGIWTHGDYAEITPHHGLIIYGRSDAVLNPGGVRIGTAEIYRQVELLPQILDSIVVGQSWQDDIRVVLFVVLKEGLQLNEELSNLIRQTIRQNATPRHVPAKILQVPEIPRTMSGKIVEIAVRQTIHGEEVTNLQSLANPQALEYFKHRDELDD